MFTFPFFSLFLRSFFIITKNSCERWLHKYKHSLWEKNPSCIRKLNIVKLSFEQNSSFYFSIIWLLFHPAFISLLLLTSPSSPHPPLLSDSLTHSFTLFLSKITWSNFKMFSNLYPLRKDISQMLNDAITCSFWKKIVSRDNFAFKNDSILNGRKRYRYKMKEVFLPWCLMYLRTRWSERGRKNGGKWMSK